MNNLSKSQKLDAKAARIADEKRARAARRTAERERKNSQEYIREKLSGSRTVGRLNRHILSIERMLKPEHLSQLMTETDGDPHMLSALIESKLKVHKVVVDDCHKRLRMLLPTLKSVELKGTADDGGIEVVIRRED